MERIWLQVDPTESGGADVQIELDSKIDSYSEGDEIDATVVGGTLQRNKSYYLVDPPATYGLKCAVEIVKTKVVNLGGGYTAPRIKIRIKSCDALPETPPGWQGP